MASYNQVITRGSSYADNPGVGAANLIPVEQANVIMAAVPQTSAALQLFQKVQMSRYQMRVPVMSVLPSASFVAGEVTPGTLSSGLKPTTTSNWEGRYLQAEEIACLMAIPDNVMSDSDYDIIGALTPHIAASIGRALDGACFFGAGKPPSYPAPIVDTAISAGNVVTAGTAAQSGGSLAADIANLYATVENDGFDVNGVLARTQLRARVRNARMTTGQELSEIQVNEWYGQPVAYAMRGLWPTYSPGNVTGTTTSGSPTVTGIPSTANLSAGDSVSGTGIPASTTILSVDSATQVTLDANATASGAGVSVTPVAPAAVVGDWDQAILGVREDVTYEISNTAVITDAAGNIQVNAFQQDAHILRVVARYGFTVSNVATYDQPNEAVRWPFGVLVG
jgi:hypothetical protein